MAFKVKRHLVAIVVNMMIKGKFAIEKET